MFKFCIVAALLVLSTASPVPEANPEPKAEPKPQFIAAYSAPAIASPVAYTSAYSAAPLAYSSYVYPGAYAAYSPYAASYVVY